MDYTELAKNTASLSASLAGLTLVFLGVVISSFAAYDATQQDTVRGKYAHRAIVAAVSLLLAVLAGVFAYLHPFIECDGLVLASSVMLLLSVIGIAYSAILQLFEVF